jgi:hypothetical protein
MADLVLPTSGTGSYLAGARDVTRQLAYRIKHTEYLKLIYGSLLTRKESWFVLVLKDDVFQFFKGV